MNTLVVADAGSTKIDWAVVVVDDSGLTVSESRKTTPGANAAHLDARSLENILAGAAMSVCDHADKVYYYGAGCATEEQKAVVRKALEKAWRGAEINADSDLPAAAKALFGDSDGIAVILGTGSNSGLYRDSEIVANTPPLGFILGDEGSGASIGKRLLADALRGIMPSPLSKDFLAEFDLDKQKAIRMVYRNAGPSAFLGQLAVFAGKHADEPYIQSLLHDEFIRFFSRNILLYPDARNLPIGIVGSTGFHFQKQIISAAEELGLTISKFLKAPLPSLIEYHKSKR